MRVYKYETADGRMVVGDDDRKVKIQNMADNNSTADVFDALYGHFNIKDVIYDYYGFDYDTAMEIVEWARAAEEGEEKRIFRIGNHGVYDLKISIFCDGKFSDPDTERKMKRMMKND